MLHIGGDATLREEEPVTYIGRIFFLSGDFIVQTVFDSDGD